jgi:F-type H+-transporting ATPase subunit a
MMEHELWFTAILNKILGGPVAALLVTLHHPAADAAHPIPNYIAMELLVAVLIVAGAVILRSQLSVESPGTFQHIMETIVEFISNMNEEIIGHGAERYLAMIGTLGIFIGVCNIIGLIPTLQTPTGRIEVTLGCAVAAFLYYNFQGIRHHGPLGYLKHFCGPGMGNIFITMFMGLLMFPIEVVGNVGRLLSLSVRLYANMFVGDILERVFTGLIPIAIPAVFMALHLFVSALQAYIFMLLPAIYISMATSEEH